MRRILLSELSSLKVYSDQGIFATGDTVTIDLYPNGSATIEPVDSNACVEIGTTGNFYFDLDNITTKPTTLTEYYFVMSDTTTKKQSGLITAGGWVEYVEPLGDADTCKITVDIYEADGSTQLDATDLFDSLKKNYIELKTAFYSDSRYYKIAKYRPSYDQVTAKAFWLMPQGATVNVKIESIGIDEQSLTVPAQSTIDLYTWINT